MTAVVISLVFVSALTSCDDDDDDGGDDGDDDDDDDVNCFSTVASLLSGVLLLDCSPYLSNVARVVVVVLVLALLPALPIALIPALPIAPPHTRALPPLSCGDTASAARLRCFDVSTGFIEMSIFRGWRVRGVSDGNSVHWHRRRVNRQCGWL